jgi:hypothetical protein
MEATSIGFSGCKNVYLHFASFLFDASAENLFIQVKRGTPYSFQPSIFKPNQRWTLNYALYNNKKYHTPYTCSAQVREEKMLRLEIIISFLF